MKIQRCITVAERFVIHIMQGVVEIPPKFYCHLYDASEQRQVVMVAPSSWCLIILFYLFQDTISAHHTFGVMSKGSCLDRKSILCYELKILSRTISFWCNMKWAGKALCVVITDSTVLKKCFNSKLMVFKPWLYLKEKKKDIN